MKLQRLQKEVQKKYSFKSSILGESEAMHAVYEKIEKARNTNITVSISGETGTGKELVAKAIHYNSKRKDKSFVAFNVAAVPSELIESELFGHEKGAFTGATYRRIGKFEEADGGTLFLDEIAEMDPSFQVKLLRALQEKEIVRVGSNQTVKTDCRIIVATNKNLKEEVKKGNFREDLYYRLLGLSIELPPLRERGNDVLILAKYYIDLFCRENHLPLKKLSDKAMGKLLNHTYPGNIRELKSILNWPLPYRTMMRSSLPIWYLIQINKSRIQLKKSLPCVIMNLKIIKSFLNKYNNDIKLVAEKLGIGVSTIYRLLKEIKH